MQQYITIVSSFVSLPAFLLSPSLSLHSPLYFFPFLPLSSVHLFVTPPSTSSSTLSFPPPLLLSSFPPPLHPPPSLSPPLWSAGARVLYRLQPEAHDDVIKLVTNLSDNLKDRKLKVYHVAMEMLCCYGNAMLLWKCTVQREIFVGANFRIIDQNILRINFRSFKFRMIYCTCASACHRFAKIPRRIFICRLVDTVGDQLTMHVRAYAFSTCSSVSECSS